MAYTADDILADAKLRAFYPTSGAVFADSDILSLASDELLGILTAREMAAVQGHLAVETTVPLVANQQRYDIPYRAAGSKLRYVALIDSNGNRSNLRPGRPERFVTTYNIGQTGSQPTNCWFEDGRLVLYQVPLDASKSLVMGIYIRPGRLQIKANASSASAAAAVGATTINCAAIPSYMNGATSIDIIRAKPPFQVIAYDLPVTALSTGATSITIAAPGIPSYPVAAGDWITLPEESVAPQIPAEAIPLLSARTALRLLRARGDLENGAALAQDIGDLEANVYTFLANRNEAQTDTLSANDLLSGGKSRFGFGLGGF